MNRIEQIIQDMEQYIDSCKTQMLNSHKVIIDRGAFDDFITDLKLSMPEVIQRSEKIVNNRDTILNDAKSQAEEMVNKAQERNQSIIDESEYVQLATEQAQRIIENATEQAQQIIDHAYAECDSFRSSTMDYALSSIEQLRSTMEESMTATRDLFEQHLNQMNEQYQNVAQNHDNLLSMMNAGEQPEEQAAAEPDTEEEETEEPEE